MAIKSFSETGFIVTVKLPDGNRWDCAFQYQAIETTPLGLWAERNGFSQALTDCIAGVKDTAQARTKLNAKADSFLKGEVPTERTGSARSFGSKVAEEAFKITVEILRNLGLKKAQAEDMIDNGQAVAFLTQKTNLSEEAIMGQITAKAQRRVEDATLIPAA